ncbi:MAG: LuxR C-terminal-related transcriptional regulator [Cyclobacteriaceae bacterium]
MKQSKDRITKRQTEILQLMAEGYKEEDIAHKLGISHVTLRRHKSLLYPRLGVNNSVSAVVTAIDLGLIKWELSTKNRIIRNIEFQAEYLQSGISIMNYFSTILQQKQPDLNSIVRIEQEGLRVRLLVIPEDGDDIQIIERTLEEYGLVISGQMKVNEFLTDNLQALQLENKLEIAKLELRFAHKQLELERTNNQTRIDHLEKEVTWLRGHIGNTLSDMKQIALNNANSLIQEVIHKFPTNDKALMKSLDIIENSLLKNQNTNNKEEVVEALESVKKKNPEILKFIKEFAQKTVSSTSGKLLYDLISSVI